MKGGAGPCCQRGCAERCGRCRIFITRVIKTLRANRGRPASRRPGSMQCLMQLWPPAPYPGRPHQTRGCRIFSKFGRKSCDRHDLFCRPNSGSQRWAACKDYFITGVIIIITCVIISRGWSAGTGLPASPRSRFPASQRDVREWLSRCDPIGRFYRKWMETSTSHISIIGENLAKIKMYEKRK